MQQASGLGASRARRADGQFLPHFGKGVRFMSTNENVVAKESIVVFDETLGIKRKIMAGQAVPPDLVDAYRKETGEAPTEPAPDTSSQVDFDAMSVEDLQARADSLGLTIEGTGSSGKVVKADLVKALRDA